MVEPFRKLYLIKRLRQLLDSSDFPGLRLMLSDYSVPHIAEICEELTHEERLKILRNIDVEIAVDIFSDLEMEMQLELISAFREERAVRFLQEMEPDDRTDLIQSLPEEVGLRLFEQLPDEEQQEVRELSQYNATSAGGIMTLDFAHIPADITVAEALEIIRSEYRDIEMSWYVYVLNNEEQLVGSITLHQLVLSKPDERIEEMMDFQPIKTTHEIDQEDVARELVKYDLIAMPVVDFKNRMLGIVTFDDVAKVMEEEATEDQERFGGLLHGEESYDRSNTWALMKQRLPWLVILLLLASLTERIISHYSYNYRGSGFFDFLTFGILVGFFPMITATAGNAGTQAATIIVRGLATGEVDYRAISRVLLKELLVGLAMGAVLGVIAFFRVALLDSGDFRWQISLTVSLTILSIIVISTLFGSLLPMIVGRFGIDPANMSSPLITTFIDILAVLIYFNMALIVSQINFA